MIFITIDSKRSISDRRNDLKEITSSINRIAQRHSSELERVRFLYIADSETVAFLIASPVSGSADALGSLLVVGRHCESAKRGTWQGSIQCYGN